MPRYVILQHEMPAGHERPTHWDLMLEAEGALATWALAEPPECGHTINAERLADHRLAYLDYQGPVSGDRGTVSQWDAGKYDAIAIEATQWDVSLSGRMLQGRLTLTQSAEGPKFWTAEFALGTL